MKKGIKNLFLISAVMLLILPNSVTSKIAESSNLTLNGWDGNEWEKSRTMKQGLNPSNIRNMQYYIEREKLNEKRTVNLFRPMGFNIDWIGVGAIRHALVATTVGKMVNLEYISLSNKVIDFFPSVNRSKLHPWAMNITIEHLLTMTAGYERGGDVNSGANYFCDILKRPIINEPGSKFTYDGYQIILLAEIIEDFLFSVLMDFGELFNENYVMTMDNLLKFGYIYMNDGKWQSENYISSNWVNKSMSKKVTINDNLSYGYLWLINEKLGCYSAGGLSNDQLFLIPEKNTILVMLSRGYGENYLNHYYYIIENILFNKNADIILGISIGIPFVMAVIVSIIVFVSVRKIKKNS